MIYCCECCDYHTSSNKDYVKHNLTAKHKKRIETDKHAEKSHLKYHCETCDFFTSNKTDYTIHCKTAKHKKRFSEKILAEKTQDESSIIDIVKQVLISQGNNPQHELIDKQIEWTNKQIELTNKQIELAEKQQSQSLITTNNNTNNNNTNNNNTNNNINNNINKNCNNTNNTQFNLQFFLNDTCKNAGNFTEFINNIRVSFEDIKTNGELGFVNGISKIIVDNLKQLNLENRPIHCTDVKRETFYVKDENQWEKDKSVKIIEKGVNEVKRKGMVTLNEWREETPERYEENHPAEQLEYQMQGELTPGNKMDKLFPKILNIIAKETKLEKTETVIGKN